MKRSEAFPSNYLGKDDVQKPFIAVIASVAMAELKGDNGIEHKPTMHFADGSTKPMIVNNVNWLTCEESYGPDSDFWNGKPVEIYVDPTIMFGNKRVGGVRLRIPVNVPPPANNEAIVAILTTASKSGLDALQRAWEMLTLPQKKSAVSLMPKLKADALAHDQGIVDDPFAGGPDPVDDGEIPF